MHVAIESIEILQARAQPSADYSYSRGLAPWCLNRPTFGDAENPNYWSCGIKIVDGFTQASNYTTSRNVALGISADDTISDFFDADDTFVAILAPKNIPTGIDYYASTYGLSIQCQLVRNHSCTLQVSDMIRSGSPLANFNCSDPNIGLHLSGIFYPIPVQVYEYDFSRLFQEPHLFDPAGDYSKPTQDELYAAANVSDSTNFKNPWRLLTAVNSYADLSNDWNGSNLENWEFYISGFPVAMFSCNLTSKYLPL